MAKKNTDVQKVDPNLPEWLQQESQQDDSLQELKQHRVLPRIKAVQGTSSAELKADFNEGDLIVRPGDVLVAQADQRSGSGDEFAFVPIYFFTEYCKWSDLNDTDNPAIVDRTFDATAEVAKKAQNPNERFEDYGDGSGKKYRYVEHLNFVCFIYDESHPLNAEPFILDFSRGEFQTGKNFINKLTMRKMPLWAQVWVGSPAHRDRGPQRKWWGVDVDVHSEQPHIQESEAEFFKAAHEEFKDLVQQRRIIVDREDQSEEEVQTEDTGDTEF